MSDDFVHDENWKETWVEASQWTPVIDEGSPSWTTSIYQIERSDPLMGGEYGISNVQAKQLAPRTQYLLQRFLADHSASGYHTITVSNLTEAISESKFNFDGDSTTAINADIEARAATLSELESTLTNLLTIGSETIQSLYDTLLSYWEYSQSGLDFCFFTENFTFEDTTEKITVERTTLGDDSIDVSGSDDAIAKLIDGSAWMFCVPTRDRYEEVEIKKLLEQDPDDGTWRVLLLLPLKITLRASDEAYLAKTNWSISDKTATVTEGDIMITRALTTLLYYTGGVLMIAAENEDASFAVYYRTSEGDDWIATDAVTEGVLDSTTGFYISTYNLPGGETLYLKIEALSEGVIDHMVVYAPEEYTTMNYVRQPQCSANMIVSRYGALYDDEFDHLEISIREEDEDTFTVIDLTDIDTEPTSVDIEDQVNELYPMTDGTTYVWKARYYSQRGYMSAFSSLVTFTRGE